MTDAVSLTMQATLSWSGPTIARLNMREFKRCRMGAGHPSTAGQPRARRVHAPDGDPGAALSRRLQLSTGNGLWSPDAPSRPELAVESPPQPPGLTSAA